MAAVIKIQVEIDGNLDAVKKDVDDVGKKAKESGGGFNALQEVAVGALRKIGEAAINLAGAALQKLSGFVVDSISVAGDFQGKMNEVGAALGKGFEPGTEGLNEFKDLFISLGKELPVSTAEVQDAALALVKGGLDPAVIKAGALKDSLNFAAAAGMNLADAAELTIKQLGTFVPLGASVEEQTRFMADAQNLLVKAAGASTLDVDQLGDAMLAAGGQAKAAGLDYQEFVTTMGLISPAFGSAAEAGTSFKNMLVRLNPSTKAAKEAMDGLGLMTTSTGKLMDFLRSKGIQPLGDDLDTLGNQFTEWAAANNMTAKKQMKVWDSFGQSKFFDEATGKFVGMEKASELLKNALSGLSDQQRLQAMQTIFGNDAMGAAKALADAGADGYNAFAQKMLEANGVAGQAAATQQGFNFQMENMKGSLEALQITIGTALLPVLASLIGDYLTPGINAVMEFADAILNADDPLLALVQAVDGLMPGLGSLIGYITTFVMEGDAMNDFLTTTPALFQSIVNAIQTAIPVVQQMVDFITTNLIPILSAVAAMIVTYVVPGFVAWATAAYATATANIAALAPVLIPIVAIGAAVALLTTAWINDWGGIQEKTQAVWAMVKPVFDQIVTWLQVNIPIAIQAAADYWTNTLWPALQKVWAFIQDQLVPVIVAMVNDTFTALNSAVQTVSDYWTGTLEPALRAVWQFIQTYVIPIFNTLSTIYIAFLKAEVAALGALWRTVLLPALTAVWEFIDQKLAPIFRAIYEDYMVKLKKSVDDMVTTWNTSFLPAMQAVWQFIYDKLGPILANFNTNVLEPMQGWFSDIGSAVNSLIGYLNDLAKLWDSMKPPDWVVGHSPPPMANWFNDIAAGAAAFNVQLSGVNAGLAQPLGGGVGASYNTSSAKSFTYAPSYSGVGASEGPMDLALATSLAGV